MLQAQDFQIDNIQVTHITQCYGDNTGQIIINCSGGQTPYKYSIDGGATYQTSNTFSGLSAGTYTIDAQDLHTDHDYDVKTLTEPDQVFISNEEKTDVTGCYGNANGTVTITATGGTGTLKYSIDTGASYFANSGNFTGLSGGNYKIYVKDGNDCVRIGNELTVDEPTQLVITDEAITNLSGCDSEDNGSINISTSGGTYPIQFSIDGGATFHTNHNFTNLSAATYNVVVKDSKDCTTVGSEITLTEPGAISIDTQDFTNVETCKGYSDGTITLSASGGSGGLEYSIDGGSTFQGSGSFTGLYAGTYYVVVKDVMCMKYGNTIIITEPTQLKITNETETDVENCFGDATGEITITAVDGTPPYQYSIDNGTTFQASNTFSNLTYGAYQTAIKDSKNCPVYGASHLITQPTKIILDDVSSSNVNTCFGYSDGTITANHTAGGTPSYKYSIDGGTTWQVDKHFYSVSAGTYTVSVKDFKNCVSQYPNNIIITQPTQVQIDDVVLTNPSCYGFADGKIRVTASGGTPGYEYSMDGGANFVLTPVITNLSAGINYDIAVKDAHDCLVTGNTYQLVNPSQIVINSIDVTDVSTCNGDNNGSIEINASGGTNTFTYSIDNEINYANSNLFENLYAGNYNVVVKDSHDCKVSPISPIVVSQPDPLIVDSQTHTNVASCNGDDTGTITITATGGTLPITYTIQEGTNIFSNTTGTFTGLSAGLYTISLEDSKHCTTNGQPELIEQASELIPAIFDKSDITCFGDNDGEIILEASGGVSPYEYSIDGTTFTSAPNFINLSQGTYHTFVKDAKGCVQQGNDVDIIEPTLFKIDDIIKQDVSVCFGNSNGSIEIQLSGGITDYEYSIDGGTHFYENNDTFTNLIAGDYNVVVKDDHECTITNPAPITLLQPTELIISDVQTTDVRCYGEDNGEITITASGGTGDLQYSINNGTDFVGTETFTGLLHGNYNIIVKDENNCPTTYSEITINEPDTLVSNYLIVENPVCRYSTNGRITFSVSGGTTPMEFSIDGGTILQNSRYFNDLEAGIYTPYVKDSHGCEIIFEDTTLRLPESTALFSVDIDEGCSPLTVNFTKLTGGTTFLWEFGNDEGNSGANEPTHIFTNTSFTPEICNVTAYSLSEDACRDTAFATITVYPKPNIDIYYSTDTLYFPETRLEISNNSLETYTNYFWNFGDTQTTSNESPTHHIYNDCGTYEIMTRADNTWCSDTIRKIIAVIPHQPEAKMDISIIEACTPMITKLTNTSENSNTVSWTLEEDEISTQDTLNQEYDTPGEYHISMKVDGYCETTASLDTVLTVWQSPDINFDVQPDSIMPPEQPVQCYNYISEDGAEYLWDFGDGTTSEQFEPTHYYKNHGIYEVKLRVTSENKCVDSLTLDKKIYVHNPGELVVPNAFSPDGNGKNDIFKPAIIESVSEYVFSIYNRW